MTPFLKNALWVAPASLFLAWATPREKIQETASTPATKPTHSNRPQSQALNFTNHPELTSVAECQKTLAELENRPDLHPLIANALRDRALRAWVDLDPESALAHAEKNVVAWGESFGKELFRVWLDLDPESALESFQLASPALRNSLFVNFYNQLAEIDPQRTLDLIVSDQADFGDPLYDQRSQVFKHAYQRWAASAPIAALDHFQATLGVVNDLGYFRWSVTSIFETWGEKDPIAAWEYLESQDSELFNEYTKRGIESSLARFLLTAKPEHVDELSINPGSTANQWTKADLPGALKFADSLPEDHPWRSHLLVQAAERLATTDPARALSLYLDGQSSHAKENSIGFPDSFYHNTFQMLNANDPEQALQLLQSVPKNQQALALGGILTHEFATDSEAAIEKIKSYYQGPAFYLLIAPALSRALEWGGQNPTEVLAAIPEARELIKGDLLESWTQKDPEAAAQFLTEELAQNPDYNLESTSALSHLASANPVATADWLQTLPAGQTKTDAALALAANWSTFDRPAAQAWVTSLPDGPLKSSVTEAMNR